jgi:hypothetical protein
MAAATPPPSPPPQTAWDDYLDVLSLTRADQQLLDQPGTSLGEFIAQRCHQAAWRAKGASENHPQDAIDNFWRRILEAAEQEDWDEDRRWRRMPVVPGLTEAMVLDWAHACEREHELEEHKARAARGSGAASVALRQEREAERLAPILEEEEYEPED